VTCLAKIKKCPGSSLEELGVDDVPAVECSGHGECRRDPVRCREGGVCSAVCACADGFSGRACDTTAAELAQFRSVRGSLVDAMVRFAHVHLCCVFGCSSAVVAGIEFIVSRACVRSCQRSAWSSTVASPAAVAQQTATLVSISSQPDQMSDSAKRAALQLCRDLAASHVTSSTGSKMLDSLGAMLQSSLDENAANKDKLTSSARLLAMLRRSVVSSQSSLRAEPRGVVRGGAADNGTHADVNVTVVTLHMVSDTGASVTWQSPVSTHAATVMPRGRRLSVSDWLRLPHDDRASALEALQQHVWTRARALQASSDGARRVSESAGSAVESVSTGLLKGAVPGEGAKTITVRA
jgi:hypothetical protein